MRFLLALILCFVLSRPAFAADLPHTDLSRTDLPRIVSLNLCADPYLMAFAEKSQVAALTHLSRDPDLSAHADAAQGFPVSDGQIESLINLQPDIVIVSSWSDPMRNALIERLGFQLLTMDAAQNFVAARSEIIRLGQAIGRETAARAYLEKLDAEMAALKKPVDRPRILPLQRRNLTAGYGHILDDIISRAGGINLGRNARADTMRRVSLENALAAQADFILLNERQNAPNDVGTNGRGADSRGPDSRGMEFLTHPALAQHYEPRQRLLINNNLLACAGASTPRAVKALIAQLTAAP
jgi:iron complex transport system substrate-binding protein